MFDLFSLDLCSYKGGLHRAQSLVSGSENWAWERYWGSLRGFLRTLQIWNAAITAVFINVVLFCAWCLRVLEPSVLWMFPLVRFKDIYFALRGMTGTVQSVWVCLGLGGFWTQVLALEISGSTLRCKSEPGKKRKLFFPGKGVTGLPGSEALNKHHSHQHSKCSELSSFHYDLFAHWRPFGEILVCKGRIHLEQVIQSCMKTLSHTICV